MIDKMARMVMSTGKFAGRLLEDEEGQDLIEYALLAATIAVAVGAIFPTTIAPNICQIFSKVSSSLGASGSAGG